MSIAHVQEQSIPYGGGTADTDTDIPLAVVCELPLTSILASPYNPRDLFDEQELNRLARSMKHHGQQVPVQVRPHPTEIDRYELVDGERRFRAAQVNGAATIKALIEDTADVDARVRSLITSLMKVNLNPIEAAKGFQSLVDDFHWTQDRIGEEFGMDQATVNGSLHLLRLDPVIQGYILSGKLSPSHGDALRGVEDAVLVEFAMRAVSEEWSVATLRKNLRAFKVERAEATAPPSLGEATVIDADGNEVGKIPLIPRADADPVDRVEHQVIGEREKIPAAPGANDQPTPASTSTTPVSRLTASRGWLEAAAQLYAGDKFPTEIGAWVPIEAVDLDGEIFCIVSVDRLTGIQGVKAYHLTEAPSDAEPSIKGRVPGQAYTGCTATWNGNRYILCKPVEIVREAEDTDWPAEVAAGIVESAIDASTEAIQSSTNALVEAGRSSSVALLNGKHFALSVTLTPDNYNWLQAEGITVDDAVALARAKATVTEELPVFSRRTDAALAAIIAEHVTGRSALSEGEQGTVNLYALDIMQPVEIAEAIIVWRAKRAGLVFEEGG